MSKKHRKHKKQRANYGASKREEVSVQSPETGPEKKDESKATKNTKKYGRLIKIASYAGTFFAWWTSNRIMALFTVVIAFIGILQVKVYNSQLDAMRKDQRPWMSGSARVASNKEGGPIFASMTMTNTGKTAARKYRAQSVIVVVKNGDSPGFTYNDHVAETETAGIVAPNDPMTFPVPLYRLFSETKTLEPWSFTSAEQSDFDAGNIFFEVYSEVTYWDQFNKFHWLHFCHFTATNKLPIVTVSAHKCTDYNDADNN